MLAPVILALLGAVAAIDPNCTYINSAGVLSFTPAATACQDNAPTTVCDQLFNAAAANTAPPGPDQPETPNRVVGCYQTTTPAAPSQDVKNAAISTCPKYCGFCCVTPAYNCANSPTPRINCGTITPAMCQSVQWRTIIAQDCPSACGFCLLGGCIDAAPDCNTQPTICSSIPSFAATNCQRTCNLCNAVTTPATSAVASSTCGNTNVNCANWVANGFCASTFYTAAQKMSYCGTSCGLCGGK